MTNSLICSSLAVAAGITRQYLGKIESGGAAPSEEIKENLLQALERYNSETLLTMLFDYVRIRFPTTDVRFVVETILKLKLDFMIHEGSGFYSYPEHYYMGDIFVLVSPEQEKGVLLELKEKGCRSLQTSCWHSIGASTTSSRTLSAKAAYSSG